MLGLHSFLPCRYIPLRLCVQGGCREVKGSLGISTGEVGRTQLSEEEKVGEVGFLV